MSAIFYAFFKRFGAWIMAALSLIGAVFVAMKSAASVGKAKAEAQKAKDDQTRNEQLAIREINAAREAANKEVETVKEASNAQNEVNKLNNGNAADRLRNEWARD